jgi:hypothetical protein
MNTATQSRLTSLLCAIGFHRWYKWGKLHKGNYTDTGCSFFYQFRYCSGCHKIQYRKID